MAAYKDEARGTWYVSFHYNDWTGKNKRKLKRGFRTRKEALEYEQKFLLQQATNLDMRFEDFYKLYEEDLKPKLKLNTWRTKDVIFQKKLIPYFKDKKMNEISPANIIKWQNEMIKKRQADGKPYKPTYLKTMQSELSAIFNHAVRFYNLRENPVKKAGTIGKGKADEMDFWTKEEYLKFIECVKDKPISYYAFQILYWCGIREGELLALTPVDIDFENKKLHITKSYGKLSIVQGDPGDGKSTLILNIAAKLSRGECIDENMNITEPVNVIYQTAEDGLADTVKPRLEAANADCSRISIIDESDKSVSMTDDRIEEAIKRENAKLCIFDPIQAYLGGDTDMNRANEAREMTKKLGSIAERTGCAIVLIGHMNKGSGAKAAYRGMGSIDFFAVARSVMLVGRIEGQSNLRAMIQIKNNLAAFGHPKAFELAEDGFHWLGDYEITADEVLGGMVPKASKLEMAKQFLREQAERTQKILSTEIIELAAQEGISKRTLETAKKELKIKAERCNNNWYWNLRA